MRFFLPVFAALLLFSTVCGRAQAQAYDVSTIKPSDPSTTGHVGVHVRDNTLITTGTDAQALLQLAFGVSHDLIANVPKWSEGKRFDVTAKDSSSDASTLKKLTDAQIQQMTQALLVERFGLRWHTEQREVNAYELIAVHPTAAMKPVDKRLDTVNTHNRHMDAKGVSMADLARELEYEVDRPVVDHTGLKGFYDLQLQWRPDTEAANAAATSDASAPPILFTALQEQLGLRLRSSKQTASVIVVDNLTPPTEN